MSQIIKIPDLGGAISATVVEVSIEVGSTIDIETPLITLEGDKATMDIPSPIAGVVESIEVSAGDTVSEGQILCYVQTVSDECVHPEAETTAQQQVQNDLHHLESEPVLETLCIPDLGGADQATVVAISVMVGSTIELEDPLITLEGDKATMDIPAASAGQVETIHVAVGETVKTGQAMLDVMTAETLKPSEDLDRSNVPIHIDEPDTAPRIETVCIPDLGDAAEATIVDIQVKIGEQVTEESPLMTLEGDKAAMEVPSPFTGTIESIDVQAGESVKTGQPMMTLSVMTVSKPLQSKKTPSPSIDRSVQRDAQAVSDSEPSRLTSAQVYAGPGVRRMAKQLGVDLARVKGSGRKGRILKKDLEVHVRKQLAAPQSNSNFVVAPWPKLESEGPVEFKPLPKLRQVAGQFLHRNWVHIPHVTQFDQADFTDLEAWRQSAKAQAAEYECRLSPLVLVMKVLVESLKAFPDFNASLNEAGTGLTLKQYYHFGVAVDSPNGLVVPVIRDVDQKDLVTLSKEIAEVAEQARTQGLRPDQMKGSSFTLSSLGGIGGQAFTPIVNAPDVAILGLSKTQYVPVYDGKQFIPRLMLPLSLSYDHRAIDGADGVRFTVDLANRLAQAHQFADQWWPN